MIQIAIVEDEKIYADMLKQYVTRYTNETGEQINLTFYQDGKDILEDYSSQFNILLMDIQMQNIDGMTAAEKIRAIDPKVIIMFITSRLDYAIRGYEVEALDYMVKPVSYFDFSSKLKRAVRKIPSGESPRITINVSSGVIMVHPEDIYYVESEGHILIFHTKLGVFSERGKMKDREEELVPMGFFRSNKCYIVNLSHVDGIQDGCSLVNGEKLLISRARKTEFMKALTDHI